jgi:hypothetical protein
LNQANKDESKVVKAQLHKALQIMSGKPAAPKATQKPSFLGNVLKAATRYYGTTTSSDNMLSTATTLEDTAAAALRAKTFMALLTTLDEHKALADSVPFGNFIALFEAVQQLTPTISGSDAQVANAEWTAGRIKRGLDPDINKLYQEIATQDKLLLQAGVQVMEPGLVRTVVLKILVSCQGIALGQANYCVGEYPLTNEVPCLGIAH